MRLVSSQVPRRMTYIQAGRMFRVLRTLHGSHDYDFIFPIDLVYIDDLESLKEFTPANNFADFLAINANLIQVFDGAA